MAAAACAAVKVARSVGIIVLPAVAAIDRVQRRIVDGERLGVRHRRIGLVALGRDGDRPVAREVRQSGSHPCVDLGRRDAADRGHPRCLVQRTLHDRGRIGAVAEVEDGEQQHAQCGQDGGELDQGRTFLVAAEAAQFPEMPHWVSLSAPILLPISRTRAHSVAWSVATEAWWALLAQSSRCCCSVEPNAITQIEALSCLAWLHAIRNRCMWRLSSSASLVPQLPALTLWSFCSIPMKL